MTMQAQNSFLKTLEEPPQNSIIILITNNENSFLSTIKSRCTKIFFEELKEEDIKEILKKQYNVSVKDNILINAKGSIKKALELKKQEKNFLILEEIFNKLNKINLLEFLKEKEKIISDKENIEQYIDYLINLYYRKIQENKISIKDINCIEILEKSKQKIKKNINKDMIIDYILINIWEETNG